jgi:hypothetical protein
MILYQFFTLLLNSSLHPRLRVYTRGHTYRRTRQDMGLHRERVFEMSPGCCEAKVLA